MSRKSKPKTARRTSRIYPAFTPEEAAQIKAKAKQAGVLPARFVRDAALKA